MTIIDTKGMVELRKIITPRQVFALANGLLRAIQLATKIRPQTLLVGIGAPVSDSEQKDRMQWCVNMALMLYKDKGWPIERIVDWMPAALISHLDGTEPAPDDRTSWVGN